VDGEARIIHSDRQDRYDGNLSNRLSRDSFVRKNDNHNQIRDQFWNDRRPDTGPLKSKTRSAILYCVFDSTVKMR